MSKLTDVPKRILIGRALRSDRLGETLLPKRVALPVFASDPLSSVAYAPGEVLLVLSVAGLSAYHFSPWIAAAIVVLMVTVVASYRRIDAPSPVRRAAGCCGGGRLAARRGRERSAGIEGEFVVEQVQRLAGLTLEEAGWDGTVVPAEGDVFLAGLVPAWGTCLQCAVTADGRAGLRRHRAHRVEAIDHCMIAVHGVSVLGIGRRDRTGMDSVEEIAATGSPDRPVVSTPRPGARPPAVRPPAARCPCCASTRANGRVDRVHGRPFFRERADARTHRVANGGCSPVQPQSADTLVTAVLQGLLPRKGDMALRPQLRRRPGPGRPRRPSRRRGRGARHRARGAAARVSPGRRRPDRAGCVPPRPHRAGPGRLQVLPRSGIAEVDLIVLDPRARAPAGRRAEPASPARARAHRGGAGLRGGAGPGSGVLPGGG
ncbi:hypothetical protein SHIRM173S_01920 [Streptomyces hirsutus]